MSDLSLTIFVTRQAGEWSAVVDSAEPSKVSAFVDGFATLEGALHTLSTLISPQIQPVQIGDSEVT